MSQNMRGYPQAAIGNGKKGYTHRLIYEAMVGPIPDGLHLDHKCNNRKCCNPEHLEPVTAAENNRRAWERLGGHPNITTHCPAGHKYVDADRYPSGGKRCRKCFNERRRAEYRAKKALAASAG
jgi:hypothetical protein